jgi:hypothetical protein
LVAHGPLPLPEMPSLLGNDMTHWHRCPKVLEKINSFELLFRKRTEMSHRECKGDIYSVYWAKENTLIAFTSVSYKIYVEAEFSLCKHYYFSFSNNSWATPGCPYQKIVHKQTNKQANKPKKKNKRLNWNFSAFCSQIRKLLFEMVWK